MARDCRYVAIFSRHFFLCFFFSALNALASAQLKDVVTRPKDEHVKELFNSDDDAGGSDGGVGGGNVVA
jgi:MED7 protein